MQHGWSIFKIICRYNYPLPPGIQTIPVVVPPGYQNHTFGGADRTDVQTGSQIFCPVGFYCPSTIQKIPCSSGHYCGLGSTFEYLVVLLKLRLKWMLARLLCALYCLSS
ncbi:hypothetical protein DsansV1_C05g0055271 [Dioscorea sansibarensis]